MILCLLMLCYTCEVFLMFCSLSKDIPTASLWLDDAWGTCVTNGVVACSRARWYDKHHGRSTLHNEPTCSHQPRVGWYGSMYGFLEFFSLLACYPFIKNPFFQGSSKEHVCTDVKSFVSLETYVVLCLFFILLLSFFFSPAPLEIVFECLPGDSHVMLSHSKILSLEF